MNAYEYHSECQGGELGWKVVEKFLSYMKFFEQHYIIVEGKFPFASITYSLCNVDYWQPPLSTNLHHTHIPPAIMQKVLGNGKKVSVELMSNHEVVNIFRLKAHHGIQWKSLL